MSTKASRWARQQQAANRACPSLKLHGETAAAAAYAVADGTIYVSGGVYSQADAARLGEWLLDVTKIDVDPPDADDA